MSTLDPAVSPESSRRVPAPGDVLNIMGGPMTFHCTGALSEGRQTTFECTGPVGMGVPTHTHQREDEMIHVIAGRVDAVLDGRLIKLGPGDTAYLPRAVPHSWAFTEGGGDGLGRATFTATPSGIEAMFQEMHDAMPDGVPNPPLVAEICSRHRIAFS